MSNTDRFVMGLGWAIVIGLGVFYISCEVNLWSECHKDHSRLYCARVLWGLG